MAVASRSPLFEVAAEGFVTEQPVHLTCCHARCVELGGGELLACFATNSGVGTNNFETKASRSFDGGQSWSAAQPVFRHLHDQWSIAGSLTAAPDGSYLVLYGEKIPRSPTDLEESFYKAEMGGMKRDEAFFSVSRDAGAMWPFTV